jgi:hypothetical protein
MTELNQEATIAATNAAIQTVAEGPSKEYIPALRDALFRVVDKGLPFTVDDVWEEAGPELMDRVPNRSVLGAIMRVARSGGHIVRIDDAYLTSVRPVTHGVPHRVWMPRKVAA